MKAVLNTLSPLHIGSGEVFTNLEYVVKGGYIYLIDLHKLTQGISDLRQFQEHLKSQSGITKIITERRLNPEDISSYKIAITSAPPDNAEIHEFIKTPIDNKCYIPGSSLKGALRTAVLWMKLKNEVALNIDNLRGIEDNTFGKFNDSIMSVFYVSDSLNYAEGKIMHIKIASPSIERSTMEYKGSGFNTPSIENATTLYYECVDIGQSFEFNLSLAPYDELLSKKINTKILNSKSQLISLTNIINACNHFSKYQIEQDCRYIDKYNLTNFYISNFYKDTLIPEFNSLKPNECLLRMSWGGGWLSKTISSHVKDTNHEFFNQNKAFFGNTRGIDAQHFPKTRRFVVQDNMPMYALGWVKISFDAQVDDTEKLTIDSSFVKTPSRSQATTVATQSLGDALKKEPKDRAKETLQRGYVVEAKIVKIKNNMAEVETVEKFDNLPTQRIKDVRLYYNHTYKAGDVVKLKLERFVKDIPVFEIKEGA